MAKRKDEQTLAGELADLTDRIFAGEQIDGATLGDAGDADQAGDLANTVQKLKTTSQTTPDSAFAIRLRNLAMAALPQKKETVSERLNEVISRLVGDEDFRNNFFASPETTLQRAGYQLSPAEIAALKEMEPENLQEWMTDLDERISKSGLL
ncbi:MAG: Franean1_4349 family RiPP [Anaerolineales bacterium]|nr:Franean1_4349 family RiPP [Anaerolineales bacterium]